jgi:mannosylglucosylglycerate synthase
MKIILIHYAAPPVVGGVETVLARQAEILSRYGHKTSILAGRGASWDPTIPVFTVPLLDSRHPEILRTKSLLDQGIVPDDFERTVLEIEHQIRPYLKEMDWVIVHNVASLHKNLPLTDALYRLHLEFPKIGFILWHHDLAWKMENYSAELYPGYPWDLIRIPWPGVRQVVISESRLQTFSQLMGLEEADIHVVPAGVDLYTFFGLQDGTRELLKKLNMVDTEPILLAPVRLTRRKNLELALEIIACLKKEMPHVHLIITGPTGAHNPTNADYFRDLKQLRFKNNLEDTVDFLADYFPNGLSDEQVADLYRIADGLLITSHEEGFGIPILEAGLSRMMIFCSDLPPLKALAENWAHYFPIRQPPDEIARMIARILKNDSAFQLRAKIRREFTWDAIYLRKIAPLLKPMSSS